MIDDFESNFFQDASIKHVEFDILNDQWNALDAEFADNEWSRDDRLRYVLAAGLRCIQNEQMLQSAESGKIDIQNELKKMQNERMQLDGRYAVMKYRTYQFMQAAKVLEWKLNVARTEIDGLTKANQLLRTKLGNPNQP